MTRPGRLLTLALGAGLLWFVLAQADLGEVWSQVATFGLAGFAVVVAIFACEFSAETAGWQATLTGLPWQARWFRRLFLVRLVGEAINDVTPMGSLGGEPVKAVLLRRYYGVPYGESGASLVLATTLSSAALVLFLAGGFALVLADPRFPAAHKHVAGAGLALLALAIGALFLVQRLRVSSRLAALLARTRLGARLLDAMHLVEGFEDRLVAFYTRDRGRGLMALALMLLNWYLGVLAIWCSAYLLGHPISLAEAYMIEALTQLVRAGTFYIPASIGAQEGAFMVAFEVLTGQGSVGLAVGLIKRGRELLWIALGFGAGWLFSLRPTLHEAREPRHDDGKLAPPP